MLVTEVDGHPVPKLIDFGIVKGLDQSLAGLTLMTGDRLIGTPGYMSPEALGHGGDVDTLSDVYSLGILLYKLLTGLLPWPDEDTPLKMLSRTADSRVTLPSRRVTTLDESERTAVASCRGIEGSDFSSRLRGDLDWITLKAIAFDPSERYGSAADLASDIERFLAHEPLSARPPTARYLLRKLVRRHRGRVFAAAITAVTLMLGIVGTGIGLVRARAEAQRADQEAMRASSEADTARAERDRAIEAQQTSEELSSFLIDLFQAARPSTEDASTTTARELLQRGVEALDSRLKDQPRARGVLLHNVGYILANWDDLEKAEALLLEAIQLLEASETFNVMTNWPSRLQRLAILYRKEGHYQKVRRDDRKSPRCSTRVGR